MNSAPVEAARPPTRRDLKSPYFLFRTPDGLGSYLTAENLPILVSPKEPLSRFLARARISENGTVRSLEYDLPATVLETAKPMEVLPQSEIDLFAAAVKAFYACAHADAPRIVPHEKRLRAHFRLPDPDLERDAYWVYGPPHDRRLLILWGAERQSGTSLPLGPDSELKIAAGGTLQEKLQGRAMTWEVRQREALRFAFDSAEPISRYLARPAVDAQGRSLGLSASGRMLSPNQVRPLRRLYTSECTGFDRAARSFYDRALGANITPYEREIRQAFRLPDPDRSPSAYLVSRNRLVISLSGKETKDQSLPLIDHRLVQADPPAPAPAPSPGLSDDPAGPVVVGSALPSGSSTVAAKLRARSISSALVVGLRAVAVLAVLGGAVALLKSAVDRTPPKVVESADYPSARDGRTVVLKFSKAISGASLASGPAKASFHFGDDDASVDSAQVDPKDATRVILSTTPLTDGKTYRLTIDAVTDTHGRRLPEATSVTFKYLDTVQPRIATVSAGENANQLILVFSKAVAEASVARGGSYTVFTLEGGGEGAAQRIVSGRLDPEDKSSHTVVLEGAKDFVVNQPYRLESLGSVTDSTVSKNPAFLPAKGLDFDYRDVLPPRIREVSASAAKLEVSATFSKPLDPVLAVDSANYTAEGPDKSLLSFVPGPATLDPTGKTVTLRIAPERLHLGTYHLTVHSLKDRMNNQIGAPLTGAFEFADSDGTPLRIVSHALVTADNVIANQITLAFNRALNPDDSLRQANYSLLGADRSPLDLAVTEVRRVPDDPAKVLLILSQPPTAGVKIVLHITGLSDLFGQKLATPIEYAFVPPGIPDPTEQVLGWKTQPVLKGDSLTLSIREAVTRRSALALQNYVLSNDSAHVRAVTGFEVKTDEKTGSRTTQVVLKVEVPPAARNGLTVRARSLRAEGLEFLGEQRLRPADVASP